MSEEHQISSKSLIMQTGQPGIKACTYSCPKIKEKNKTIYRNQTFRF